MQLPKHQLFIKIFLLLFLLTDWTYSFLQNYHQSIQGDLVPVVLPEPQFAQVLEEPFGWTAIKEGGVNRYFVHQALILKDYILPTLENCRSGIAFLS